MRRPLFQMTRIDERTNPGQCFVPKACRGISRGDYCGLAGRGPVPERIVPEVTEKRREFPDRRADYKSEKLSCSERLALR